MRSACAHTSHVCAHAHLKRPLELTHTVVTEAAVRGPRRPEDLAGEAVLELHRLPVDHHLPGPGRRPVAGAAVGPVYGHAGRVAREGRGREDKGGRKN